MYDFAKGIISWVMRVSSALRDNGGAGKIVDNEMWDHLEELRYIYLFRATAITEGFSRNLIHEICTWATARLVIYLLRDLLPSSMQTSERTCLQTWQAIIHPPYIGRFRDQAKKLQG